MNRSPCPQGKIRNPITGRCVKKSGAIGKHILREHPSMRSVHLSPHRSPRRVRVARKSPCGAGKIRNPATNRCVDKHGRIGKQVRREHPILDFSNRVPSQQRSLNAWIHQINPMRSF